MGPWIGPGDCGLIGSPHWEETGRDSCNLMEMTSATTSELERWPEPQIKMREKQMSYINAYIWNLERRCWWTYLQASSGDTDIENRFCEHTVVNRCSATNKINFGNTHTHQKYPWALRRQHLCLQNGSESQHLLDVLERDFLRLLGGHGCDVHLQRCQPQGYVIFQLRPKPLLNDIVTTLKRHQQRAQLVKGCIMSP